MKQFSTFLNGVLASVLVFLVVFAVLPNLHAGAAPANLQATPTATQSAPAACDAYRNVSVSGTAVVHVTPDRALIQLGVQSNGRTAAAVQAANTASITHVSRDIKTFGVEAKDISTDWYVIEPIYEDYDSLHIKGYRINNTIAITLRDVNKVNDVITAALQAGANQVIHVELYTSELRKYRDQAREMAMKAAVEKAQALAQAGGAQVGCVRGISENSWSYYNGWYGGGQAQMNIWTQNVSQNATTPAASDGGLSDDDPVSLGQISVKAEVSVTFSLN